MDLKALHANYQPVKLNQQAPSASAVPHKNFLQSLIPAAGGTAGAVGGAAIGTALLPGIGTLAGALLGGAFGGGAGKVGENALEHKNLTSGVAGEAALSGAFGAGPLRLAKFGVDAARGAKAGMGLADALTGAGTSAADSSITRAVGDKLSNSGTKLIAKEFRLTPTQQANFKNLHGEEATQVLRRFGVNKPEDVKTAIQPLQDSFNGIVHQVPAISKADLSAGLEKVYKPLLESPALFEQGLGQQIKSQADELLKQAKGGSLSADKVNELRKTFDAAVNYTQRGAPEYNVIKKTADALRGTLQTQADKAGVKVNGQSFKEIGKDLSKLHSLDETVSKQSYNGSGSLPFSLGNTPGAVIGSGAGPAGALAGYVANAAINSPLGRRALAGGTIKAGEKLVGKGEQNASNAFGIKQVGKRVGGVGLADALVNQSLAANNSTNANTTSTDTNIPTTANIDGQYQNPSDLSTPTADAAAPNSLGITKQQIFGKMQEALVKGDTKGLNNLKTLYDVVAAEEKNSNPKSKALNSTQQQQANNAQSGLSAIQTIQSELQNNPHALLKMAAPGDLGKNLAGAGTLNSAIKEAADVISRLRTGAAINANEEKLYRSYLPKLGDNPSTITYKLNKLSTLYSKFANPQQPSSSLADALSQLQ